MIKSYTQKGKVNFTPSPTKNKIGILGGTFNPIHLGHVDMAQKLYYEFSLDEVMLVVSGDPPHKNSAQMPSAKHRFNMVLKAAENLPFANVSDIEIARPGKIYTVDTLRILKNENPSAEYFYIIGADTLFQLESWKEFSEVFKLCSFICMEREGSSRKDCLVKAADLSKNYSAKIYFSSYKGKPISSTAVREVLQKGQSAADLIPAEVERYIEENGLYK